jgi:hypothetical protein
MGTLEKVIELKKQGVSDEKIISQLKEEGIKPMEINDSLNQAKIKEAVGEENKENPTENMQPSMMQTEEDKAPAPTPNQGNEAPKQNSQEYQPQAAQTYQPQEPQTYAPQQPQQFYPEEAYNQDYDYEEAYPQEDYGYQQDNSYSQMGSTSTETMIEIAEQVFSEKMKDLEKEMRNLKEFKTIYKSKIDDIDERIKRIEKMFDKMQIAILDKVGNFSKNINSMQKEIEMVEDSITKLNKKK